MIIGSIVILLLLIGGITLYKTYALYEEKKEFNVLKGRVPDFRKIYKEETLNGADPVLAEGLIPVEIDESGKVTKANPASEWYSYKDKRWANAIILNQEYMKTNKKKEFVNNEEIPEEASKVTLYGYQNILINYGI